MKVKTALLVPIFLMVITVVARSQTTINVTPSGGAFTADLTTADFSKPITIASASVVTGLKVVKKVGDVTVTNGADANHILVSVTNTQSSEVTVTVSSTTPVATYDLKITKKMDELAAPQTGSNQFIAKLEGGVLTVAPTPVAADFTKPIIIFSNNGITNFKVVKAAGDLTITNPDASHFSIGIGDTKQASVSVTLTADGASQPFPLKINKSNGDNNTNKMSYTEKARQFFAKSEVNAEFNNAYKYDRKKNEAYFFFDQNGVLIGPAPVNVDADDYIQVYVAVPESSIGDYAIDAVGEYSASYLSIAPHDAILSGAAQGTGTKPAEDKLTYIHQTFGPYTSENVTIKIYGPSTADGNNILKQQTVHINKLYNAGIGVTFISSDLANPDFNVVPIKGTSNNTIAKVNDGTRTLVAFNVIYFWKPSIDWLTGKLKGSDHITRGRDILKEPTLWERLNPSLGVALSDKWKENFFLGGNFEFTRGGSITAGWHYGKVQSLLDDTFKLGQDTFAGTKDDIKLNNSWKWAGFIGLTVDTRIFNALFSHN